MQYADWRLFSTDADVKKKIERCVRQAHIDPEDFNGVRFTIFSSKM